MSAIAAFTPVRLHPESTADPLVLRWVTDTEALPGPTPQLSNLLSDGTLAAFDVAPGEIRTRLAPGRTWAEEGSRVRSVLFQALSSARDAAAGHADDFCRRVAVVLDREVAPLVRSHGGAIRVVSFADGTLTVALGGTCGHCTLRNSTLRNVVADAVQSRFPRVRRVEATFD